MLERLRVLTPAAKFVLSVREGVAGSLRSVARQPSAARAAALIRRSPLVATDEPLCMVLLGGQGLGRVELVLRECPRKVMSCPCCRQRTATSPAPQLGAWEHFALPELENFISVLRREEAVRQPAHPPTAAWAWANARHTQAAIAAIRVRGAAPAARSRLTPGLRPAARESGPSFWLHWRRRRGVVRRADKPGCACV